LRKSKRIIVRTLAFAKREFKLKTRYKWPFLSTTIIMPIIHALPFIILYWGLLIGSSGDLSEITAENYLAWVLLGSIIYSTYSLGYMVFRLNFWSEKFWMTIHGTLIAPASKYYLLFGTIIQLLIQGLLSSLIFFIIAFVSFPTSFINIFFVLIIFVVALIAGAGLSLINGTFLLINENLVPFFDFFLYGLTFLSCYAIPYELYPSFLQVAVKFNPLYHIINITREVWFNNYSIEILWSFLYILAFCVISVMLGIYFFNKYTRRFGVHGY